MTRSDICKEHCKSLGIRDHESLREHLKAIFERREHQADCLVDIYRMVLPDWDYIRKIEGFPHAGHELWKFICRQFMDFDMKHHPDVFKGGLWLNNGFSSDDSLGPWEVGFDNCQVIIG